MNSKTALTIVATILMSASAKAASISLITLKAEAQPGLTASLGVNTNGNNQITGVYYKGVGGVIEQFPLHVLAASPQVLYRQSGHNLIKIETAGSSETVANLKLTYLRNALTGSKSAKYFKIRYNPNMAHYQLLNQESRPIENGYITTYRNTLGMEVGIDDIKTW